MHGSSGYGIHTAVIVGRRHVGREVESVIGLRIVGVCGSLSVLWKAVRDTVERATRSRGHGHEFRI